MITPATVRPAPDSDDYGCNWSSCGLPGRPYQPGLRCAAHTPAALRGLPELPEGPGWPRDRDPPDPPPPTDTTPRKEPET